MRFAWECLRGRQRGKQKVRTVCLSSQIHKQSYIWLQKHSFTKQTHNIHSSNMHCAQFCAKTYISTAIVSTTYLYVPSQIFINKSTRHSKQFERNVAIHVLFAYYTVTYMKVTYRFRNWKLDWIYITKPVVDTSKTKVSFTMIVTVVQLVTFTRIRM